MFFKHIVLKVHLLYSFRENWLSPVIQATWEARTVGCGTVEDFCYTGGWVSVAAVWLPSFEAVHRGGQPSYDDERRPAYPLQRQTGPELESQPDPVLIIVLYCTMIVENPTFIFSSY